MINTDCVEIKVITNQAWSQVRHQVLYKVRQHVWAQVRNKIRYSNGVRDRVWIKVRYQVFV